MIVNTFTAPVTSKYVAFDTETHTYVDGKLLKDREIRRLCAETKIEKGKPVLARKSSWWREHCEVKCWAYIVYAPEGFAIAETFEEFAWLCTTYRIKHGWFYNAPFDFSILDYDLLSRGYTHTETAKGAMQYDEMCNDFGARYRMRIVFPYEPRKGTNEKRTKWKTAMYDLRNIFPGGLAANLKSFNVKDTSGEDIRKREMDYQSETVSADDIEYMRADAAGLWHLIEASGAMLKDRYGIDITSGAPQVYTASSIAKRYVLGRMYPGNNWTYTQKKFKRDHPINLERDKFYRAHGLLGGGRVLINPHYRFQHLHDVHINRYDANSHYPAYMADMLSIYGFPDFFPDLKRAKEWHEPTSCYILEFSELYMTLKPNAIPAWRDPITTEIQATIHLCRSDTSLLMFEEEFEELQNWYDLIDYRLVGVHVYDTRKEQAIEDIMREEYQRKADCKRAGDKAGQIGSKLIMNGYGGKYSQNPWRTKITRELDGYVRRVEQERYCEEESLMQVVQGARITANGRVRLLQAARRITGNRMAEKLLYGDTDSLHTLSEYRGADPYKLGEFKQENKRPIVKAAFIAPKTYYEIEEGGEIELHAKGVHIEDVKALLKRGVPIERIYSPGYCVQSLTSLNVKGGKALLPFPKTIMKGNNDIEISIDETWD